MASKKILTPVFRASFANVFEPKAGPEGGEPKYSVVMLFDEAAQKTPEYKAMVDLLKAAVLEKFGPNFKVPSNFKMAFRDGSEKPDLDGYEGTKFATASTKQKPGVIGPRKQQLISSEVGPDGFYSGCWARATVTAYAYDRAGNKGVAFGLQNLQKVREGEAFSGRVAAENDFDEVAEAAFADEGSVAGDDPFA